MSETSHATSPIELLERGIFAARDEVFTLRHVLGAAECYGLAAGLRGWLEDSLACEAYAVEEGFEVDEELLQATLDDLRYRRRLVSAEETERWLAERQLSEDELVDALAREHWRDRFQGEVSEIRGAYAPHPGAAVQALWPALIVHQRLAPLAVALARRVVAPILMADREGPAPSPEFRPLRASRKARADRPRPILSPTGRVAAPSGGSGSWSWKVAARPCCARRCRRVASRLLWSPVGWT